MLPRWCQRSLLCPPVGGPALPPHPRPPTPHTYVQENLLRTRAPRPLLHPLLPSLFWAFDGRSYVPGATLRSRFPDELW